MISTTSDELLISAYIYIIMREEYSGPDRIIDQIQLLNKEAKALSNEIESRAKVVLKHQRKMQDLEEKVKGLQDLEERIWNEFINWSVRFEMKQEALRSYVLGQGVKPAVYVQGKAGQG